MRNSLKLNVFFFSLLTLVIPSAAAAEAPKKSQASYPGSYNFSGYANVIVEIPSAGKARLAVSDLSLFATGHINKWLNPFFEAELSNITVLQEGGSLFSNNSSEAVLERLYNESHLTDNLSIRVGKILTPFGEWNLIHAAPLVWTTTRPMTTYRSFNQFNSGISLTYAGARSAMPEIQLYVQPDGELLPKPTSMVTRKYERITGLHLNWPFGLDEKLGLSLQHSHVKNTGEQQVLTGFNFSKDFDRLAFETEAVHALISGTNAARVRDNEWGVYLQGAYILNIQWKLLARYEHFVDRSYNAASGNSLLGVSYRSAPSTVWKLEFLNQHGQQLDVSTGLYASFSELF